jgi:UDP-N-acetylmuramoyl-L-alanyl-D-glutamate--2,6-diaminopimelate ligase
VQLHEVLDGLEFKVQGEMLPISGISYDSRKVQPGDLFVAMVGHKQDGHDFAQEAQQRGAAAVLVQRFIPGLNLTQVVVDDTRYALGLAAANFYGHPSRQLRVLGITGTNGKTTTTYLVKSILEQAGYKVGLIGTIQILLGGRALESERTTPESLDLQRLFSQMLAEGVDFVVMEVSSHALELHRTTGVSFAGAVFTNLSQDHLDFHTTMDEYYAAKAKLFTGLDGPAAINVDDSWGAKLAASLPEGVVTFAVDQPADFRAQKIELENTGVSYILDSKDGQTEIRLQLMGQFNVYNTLAAAALCAAQGIALDKIKDGLERVPGVPGRFERIGNGHGLNIVVDYAHTPHGLENILRSARVLVPAGRIIVVFGAGGDRDKTKRPLMGAVAAELADYVIITSDNPRSEDPVAICSSIEQGLLTKDPRVPYAIEVNRRSAIRLAVAMAEPEDLVIIAGKGHETYQEFADGRVHFDDGEEVRAAIKELKD